MFRHSGPDHMLLHTVLEQKDARLNFTFTSESESKNQDNQKLKRYPLLEKGKKSAFYYSTYNQSMFTITILLLLIGPEPDKTSLEVSHFFLLSKRHYACWVDAIVSQGKEKGLLKLFNGKFFFSRQLFSVSAFQLRVLSVLFPNHNALIYRFLAFVPQNVCLQAT